MKESLNPYKLLTEKKKEKKILKTFYNNFFRLILSSKTEQTISKLIFKRYKFYGP